MPPPSENSSRQAPISRPDIWKTPTPFVGRERETVALRERLDAAIRGAGALVMIGGEPGVGKTRLAAELMAEARRRRVLALAGRCYEMGGAPPYVPFVEILEAAARVSPPAALRETLGDSAPEVAKLLPELTRLFTDIPPALELAPEQERHHLLNSVREFVARAARARPLLLLLDDLQWADEATLLLLQHLALQVGEMPVLILGAYRDVALDPRSPLAQAIESLTRQRLAEPLALKPLPEEGVADMLRGLSGQEPPATLVQAFYSETEGNPFFVEEVYRHLAEEGKLFHAAGDWRGLQAGELGLPAGVRLVIRRRLGHASEECRGVLTSAAVVGRAFSFELLEALGDLEVDALLEVLDEAVGAHLIVPASDSADPPFVFVHELIRQTLLAGLTAPRRQRLHRHVAEAIERTYAANLEPHLAALAVHFRLAGPVTDVEKAIDYSLRAGEAAAAAFAYGEALVHLQAALDLVEGQMVEPQRRARLLERLGDLMYLSGVDYMKGVEYLERALQLYEELHDPESAARVHYALGRAFSTYPGIQDVPRALAHYRAAEPVLALERDQRSLGYLYSGMASAAWAAARPAEGLAASRRAMAIADDLGDQILWAMAADIHGLIVAFNHGRLAEGLAVLDRAYEITDQLNHPAAYFAALCRGVLTLLLLDPRDAHRCFTEELSRPRVLQAPLPRYSLIELAKQAQAVAGAWAPEAASTAPSPQGIAGAGEAFLRGEWDGAEAFWQSWRRWCGERGNRFQEGQSPHWLARLHRAGGDLTGAAELFKDAMKIRGQQHIVAFEMMERPDLALLYVEMGRVEEAEAQLARCHEIMVQGEDWRGIVGRVALADAALTAAKGDLAGAEPQFEQALGIFRRYGLLWDEADALHVWGKAFVTAGRRHLRRALDAFDAATDMYRCHGLGRRWIDRVDADSKRALGTSAGPIYPAGLSQREVEVLRCIAVGKSSREVARELVISVRTVERHIDHIYRKTGAHGRAQATAYALANGLA